MADDTIIIDDPAPVADATPQADPVPAKSDANIAPFADPVADPAPKADPAADDWRTTFANGDEKLLGFLARHQSPKDVVEKFKRLSDDVKAGKYRAPSLPENPTDDEVAAYRKERGIPDKPEGYLEKLPSGLVVGDDDRPFVDTFLTQMHGVNADPATVNAALDAYYGIVEEQAAAEATVANEAKNQSIEALREEWGGDYKRNLNAMHGFLDTLPEGVAAAFREGKGADGVPLGYNAEVLKWLTSLALDANPLATVVPGAGGQQASALADEIASLEAKMGDRNSDYWKGPLAAKHQARYLELVTARGKLS